MNLTKVFTVDLVAIIFFPQFLTACTFVDLTLVCVPLWCLILFTYNYCSYFVMKHGQASMHDVISKKAKGVDTIVSRDDNSKGRLSLHSVPYHY